MFIDDVVTNKHNNIHTNDDTNVLRMNIQNN